MKSIKEQVRFAPAVTEAAAAAPKVNTTSGADMKVIVREQIKAEEALAKVITALKKGRVALVRDGDGRQWEAALQGLGALKPIFNKGHVLTEFTPNANFDFNGRPRDSAYCLNMLVGIDKVEAREFRETIGG